MWPNSATDCRLTVLRQLCAAVATCDTIDEILAHLDRNLRSLLPLEAVYLLVNSSGGAQSRLYVAKQSFRVAEAAKKLGFSPRLLRYLNHANTKLETVNPVAVPNGASIAILVPLINPKRILGTIVVACAASVVLTAELSLVLQEISLLITPGVDRARRIADEVRQQREKSKQAEAQYLGAIYDSAYEYLGINSPNGLVLDCNRAALTFHERTLNEMLGTPLWETPWFIYAPGASERLWNALQRVSRGEFKRWVFPLYRPNGELMVFDFSLSPVKNSEGDVLHIVAEGRPMELYDGERGLSRYNLPAPFLLPPQTRSTARRVLPRAAPEVVSHLPGIVGESAAMKQVAAAVRAVASTAVPVLLLGEAGTGKDLVARAIHNLSCSSPGRFVKLSARSDFGALLSAEGSYGGLTVLLEEIGRGTLYLDKVDELPRELQAKLFRFLSEFIEKEQRSGRSVRFRWIFSAKPDLPRKALSGQFRNDLFNLLNACMIVIPPLRERREDISALVHFFAEKYVRRCRREIISISDETLAAFAQADWPVNVLQLEAAVADAVVRAQEARLPLPRLTNVLLPVCQSEPNAEPACERLEAVELQHILNILRQSQGRVSRAAMRLGIKRTTLNSRLRRLGITADTLRGLRQSARGH